MLSFKASIDAVDDAGASPLMVAAGKGQVEIIGCLLDAGATLRLTDADGDDAMHLACRYGHEKVSRKNYANHELYTLEAYSFLSNPTP